MRLLKEGSEVFYSIPQAKYNKVVGLQLLSSTFIMGMSSERLVANAHTELFKLKGNRGIKTGGFVYIRNIQIPLECEA